MKKQERTAVEFLCYQHDALRALANAIENMAAGDLDRPLAEFPFCTLAEKVNCIADEIEGESLRLCDQDVELYLHIDDQKKERIHSADEVEITIAKLAKLFGKKKARS